MIHQTMMDLFLLCCIDEKGEENGCVKLCTNSNPWYWTLMHVQKCHGWKWQTEKVNKEFESNAFENSTNNIKEVNMFGINLRKSYLPTVVLFKNFVDWNVGFAFIMCTSRYE